MPSLNPRIILAIAAVALFALMIFAGPAACRRWQSERAQARLDHAQREAFQNSALEASTTQATVNANQVESETLSRSNERNIRDAKGSNAVVAAPVRDAGLAALCLRRVYRDAERCRVFHTGRSLDEAR